MSQTFSALSHLLISILFSGVIRVSAEAFSQIKKVLLLKSMKYIFILVFLLPIYQTIAQDTSLYSEKWQSYFSDYAKEEYATFEVEDYNKKFKVGEYYNCLVVFKDSAKSPMEFKVRFKSIQSLCNPKEKIEGDSYNLVNGYAFDKNDLKFFVFHDISFVFDGIVRKQYKYPSSTNYWSVVLIDGPIRFTKYFYTMVTTSGSLDVGVGRIQKYEDDLGSSLLGMGGFNFKKFAAKSFSDHTELVTKIEAGEAGYTRQDALKIITEYNEWVLQADQNQFKETMLFGNLVKGLIH